jgi:hypothetical protein
MMCPNPYRRFADTPKGADEQCLQIGCNGICRALFYLSAGARGALHMLTNWCTSAEFADMEEDLATLSKVFSESINDIRTHVTAWFSDFWESDEACAVRCWAFYREVGAMMLSVLATQDRQRILAAYGESA